MRIVIIHLFWVISLFVSPCSGGDSIIDLSREERAWIDENHTVRVRVGNSPPFMLTDGDVQGIAIDYLTHIFGIHGIKTEYIRDAEVTWPEALEHIKHHEVVDMVPTAKITENRQKDMIFTDEYIFAPWVIFTRTDADFVSTIDDLEGKTVSVEEGYVMHRVLKQNYPGIRLKVVSANRENFAQIPVRDLSTGVVDAYIGNLLSTYYTIQTKGYTNVKVAAPTPFDNHNQAMAIRSDWPELVSIINKTLASMTPAEHLTIRNKWLSIRYEYGIDKIYVLKWVLSVTGGAFFIIVFVLIWNKRLKTEVILRKKSEEALRQNEYRYKSAQRMGNVGNWEYDLVTETFWGSDQAKQIYGFDPDSRKFTTEEVENCIPARKEVHQALIDLIEKDKPYHLEFDIYPVSGSKMRTIRSHAEIIRDDSGAPLKVLGVIQDITDQKIAEQDRETLEHELRLSQKMESIGTLAGGIAHEFNNILSIIIGNNELVMDEVPERSLARQSTEEIRIAGLRARDVVKQLLTFSRRDNAERKVLNIRSVVHETMKLIRSSTPANIEIQQTLSDDVFPVLGNATQINQLLINLCNNAVDAVPGMGGILSIALSNETVDEKHLERHPALKPGRYVKLSVSDNGIGMEKKIIDRIFEPYFTTKEMGKGTGIGLAVVHGIVEKHGGSIIADSHPGQGTMFNILFPAHEGLLEQETDERIVLPTGKERILYVDDEPSIAKLGKRLLQRLGYMAESTTNPLKALEMVKTDPDQFDLVISDMAMPDMTGDQLIIEILKVRPDMPTIICTGYSGKLSEREAMKLGVSSFVMKPLDKSAFARTVRKVLDEAGG